MDDNISKKFYQKDYNARLDEITIAGSLNKEQIKAIKSSAVSDNEKLVENYLMSIHTPVGLLRKIMVNHREYMVPMATDEPSVVAAANNGAKMLGNITTTSKHAVITGEIFVISDAIEEFIKDKRQLINLVADSAVPNLVERGGGMKDISVRKASDYESIVDILVDPVDAMGANMVNTICEAVAGVFKSNGFDVLTGIVSNYLNNAVISVEAEIDISEIGLETAENIEALSHFGKIDIHRATTENKGIMNGIDAVVLATGNDTRATSAAIHSFASRNGSYVGLSTWEIDGNSLVGKMDIPIHVGIVGGTIGERKDIKTALSIINPKTADELSNVIASVGLVQNFAALKALTTEGIQEGHMKMQRRATNTDD